MTADPVLRPQEPSWIPTPTPGRAGGGGGCRVGPDLCGREAKRLRSRVRPGALALSPYHPGLCLPGQGGPRPWAGPHLELAPQVGHLIQPVLLYAPAAAPLTGVFAPFRFHLVEADARCWGLASSGRDGGLTSHPDHPSMGLNTGRCKAGGDLLALHDTCFLPSSRSQPHCPFLQEALPDHTE